ncbi:uncharacterized protein E0L32_009932 [Thyridium curvatum]|uniref:Uncharacterized protein n=1 Tax=Thyridium curvatum TaxID=1093900 RepID=A0A507ALW3_9PEZI|nr:uncharacterized protein E0L32_009932 [Thyridium curvatum]TPX08593.1 hypothetical protein E0L32_009932 [Thyridium curvatum]
MDRLWCMIRHTFNAKPTITEKNLRDLKDNVYIVTGSNAGVGKELAQILYSRNAKVYLAARSEEKTLKAINDIKTTVPNSEGQLVYLHLDLADLATIKPSAEEFLRKEKRLNVLFNNAGVGFPAAGSKTKQGLELQLGVNCVGPFLFTKLLTPILAETAKTEPEGATRVVWVSSSAVFGVSPVGLTENLDYHRDRSSSEKYLISKIGNFWHSSEYAKRQRANGIVSVSLNPGNLRSELWRTQGAFASWFLNTFILHPTIFGAYTELYAGFSPDISMANTGSFLAPWGRLSNVTKDLTKSITPQSQGGTGASEKFWDWTEGQIKPYQ